MWKGNPKRLPIGAMIPLPEACQKKGEPRHVPVRKTRIYERIYENEGANPLCPTFKRDPQSCVKVFDAALKKRGFSTAERMQFLRELKDGDLPDSFLPNETVIGSLSNGNGEEWGNTKISVKAGGVATKVLAIGKKKVGIMVNCGNIYSPVREEEPETSERVVSEPKPIVRPPEEKVDTPQNEELVCSPEGTFAVKGDFGNGIKAGSGRGRVTCQFRVTDRTSVGPVLGGSTSRYRIGSWTEHSNMIGGGGRVKHHTPNDWRLEADVLGGWESTRGSNKDGVTKPPIKGWSLHSSIDAKKFFASSEESLKKPGSEGEEESIDFGITTSAKPDPSEREGIMVEGNLFAQIPITGKTGPVYYRGQQVATDSRKPVVGIVGRVGFETKESNLVPEMATGLWHTRGATKPWGGKATLGAATKNRLYRVALGVELPRPHGIVEAEVNPGGKSHVVAYKKATTALEEGARPSCEAHNMCAELEAQRLPPSEASRVIEKETGTPREQVSFEDHGFNDR